MSLTPIGEPRHKITTATLRDQKLHHEPITCLTAYDYASARLVDEAPDVPAACRRSSGPVPTKNYIRQYW